MSAARNILFLIFLSLHPLVCFSQEDSAASFSEKSRIRQQQFNPDLIREFKADSEFIYELPPAARPGILKMIFNTFFEWLVLLLGNEFFAWLVLIVLVVLGVVGLGFALYGIFGIGKTIPVYSRGDDGLAYSVKEENIHEINFPEEIEHAVNQRAYRKAVRLVHLYCLKLLTDNNMIDWSPSKTNHDYLYEIESEVFQKLFSRLCYYFEYVWYGDFQVGIAEYEDINDTFKEFRKNLRQYD
ncbi:MAG: hypothetical protein MI975_02415 [Cytophagales bacterium]|nr:hypothetical protein [Cytophagales bacterium]